MFYRGKKMLFFITFWINFMECYSIQFTTISINVERGIVKILCKYRYFQDLLIDIDIDIDISQILLSISISISIFSKTTISISISISIFLEITWQNWPFKIGLSLFDLKQLLVDNGIIVHWGCTFTMHNAPAVN